MIGMTKPAVFSPACKATGPTLYVAGQTPARADGSVPDGAEAQSRLVLDKIADILAEHGLGWNSVVKLNYYLCDVNDLGGLRAAAFDILPDPPPATTLVVISGLIDPRFLVEIDAVADLSGV
jgi:enamine deaminase RidA (YjgF/YER057c/UK114 family)